MKSKKLKKRTGTYEARQKSKGCFGSTRISFVRTNKNGKVTRFGKFFAGLSYYINFDPFDWRNQRNKIIESGKTWKPKSK